MKNLKIALIDDHKTVHYAFKLLNQDILCEVDWINYYFAGNDFLNDLDNTNRIPDVAIVDMKLTNDMNGIDLLNILSTKYPNIRPVVLSMNCEALFVEHGLRAGALGYLSKGFDEAELVSCLRSVRHGKVHFNENITPELMDRIGWLEVDEETYLKTPLTEREKEVLKFIAQGLTYKEIAETLHVGKRTIESHKNNLCKKIGITRVTELAIFAAQMGLD